MVERSDKMKIFLGAELEGKADSCWFPLQLEFDKRLEKLKECNYGDELNDIGIISIIFIESPKEGFPERRLFQRKQKSADIRLRIDYKKFTTAKPEVRRQMYVQHILDSIDTLRHKVSKDYKFDEVYNDVKNILTAEDITPKA